MIASVAGAGRQRQAGRHQRHRDDDPAPVRRVDRRAGRHHEAGAHQRQAAGDDQLGAEPLHQQRSRRGDIAPVTTANGSVAHAGAQRVVAAHDLEVLRDHEDEAEQAEERRARPTRWRRRTGRCANSRTSSSGLRDARLPARRTPPAATADGAKPPSVAVEVQPWSGASIMVHTSSGRRRRPTAARPSRSNRPACGSPRLRQQPPAGDQRDDDERDVDEEDRAPGEVLAAAGRR